MKTALREEEVIRFMTREPQVHMMEIIGVNDFVPEEIELEEYVGRIDSVIGEDEALLVTTLSPVDGFRCIAAADDVIGKVDLSCLSEEEQEAYGSVDPYFTAPTCTGTMPPHSLRMPLGAKSARSVREGRFRHCFRTRTLRMSMLMSIRSSKGISFPDLLVQQWSWQTVMATWLT